MWKYVSAGEQQERLVWEIKVCSKHRFCTQITVCNNQMYVKEQPREPSCEIRQESLWHLSKMSSNIVR